MDFTSYQAEAATFTQVRRGADPAEVARYQAQVVKALRSYERELRDVQRRLNELEADRARTGAASDGAQRAFLAGVDAKQAMMARAERQAAELLEQAKREATAERARLDAAAAAERSDLIAELETLRSEAAALEAEMLALRKDTDVSVTEADRVLTVAHAEAERIRAAAATAAAAALETAHSEAEMIAAGARDEVRQRLETADAIRAEAERAAAATHDAIARDEAERVGRERSARAALGELRESVGSSERTFRDALAEATQLLDRVRSDLGRVLERVAASSVTDPGADPKRTAPDITVDLTTPGETDESGFYQRRLAGLRRRLEDER